MKCRKYDEHFHCHIVVPLVCSSSKTLSPYIHHLDIKTILIYSFLCLIFQLICVFRQLSATHLVPLVAKMVSPLMSLILGSSVHGDLKNVFSPFPSGHHAPL